MAWDHCECGVWCDVAAFGVVGTRDCELCGVCGHERSCVCVADEFAVCAGCWDRWLRRVCVYFCGWADQCERGYVCWGSAQNDGLLQRRFVGLPGWVWWVGDDDGVCEHARKH